MVHFNYLCNFLTLSIQPTIMDNPQRGCAQ